MFMRYSLRPAEILDIGRLGRLMTERQVQGLIMQLSRGLSWAVMDGGNVRALMGWWPNGDGTGEIWIVPAGGVRGSRAAAGLMLYVRRMLRALIPQDVPTFATVNGNNPSGARLVRFLGFEPMRPIYPFASAYRFFRRRC